MPGIPVTTAWLLKCSGCRWYSAVQCSAVQCTACTWSRAVAAHGAEQPTRLAVCVGKRMEAEALEGSKDAVQRSVSVISAMGSPLCCRLSAVLLRLHPQYSPLLTSSTRSAPVVCCGSIQRVCRTDDGLLLLEAAFVWGQPSGGPCIHCSAVQCSALHCTALHCLHSPATPTLSPSLEAFGNLL
jgi:hypothetical protein